MSDTHAQLNEQQEALCRQDRWDFSHLAAVFVNCTLKRSPEISNTQGLADVSMEIMRRQGVTVDGCAPPTTTSLPGCGPT